MGTLRNKLKEEQGVVLILVAILLGLLFAFAALALDVGNVMVVRNELQNISDGAALAAARHLGSIYEGMSYMDQQNYNASADAATIISVAQQTAASNTAAGTSITDLPDVVIGTWDRNRNPRFLAGLDRPDAVRVRARKDASANGPVATFFARIFGLNTVDVSATAIAALTGESTIGPGELSPVGIDEEWFFNREVFCNQVIRFYPTGTPEGCAGWNVFFGTRISDDGESCPGAGHASANCLRNDILETWLNDPSYRTPGAENGDTFQFTGGTLGNNTFQAFYNLWNYMRTHDDDGQDDRWTTSVVVYERSGCENPEGARRIVGFATVEIFNVVPPNVEITARVICEMTQYGRGGGGEYGTMGSIPGLVQ